MEKLETGYPKFFFIHIDLLIKVLNEIIESDSFYTGKQPIFSLSYKKYSSIFFESIKRLWKI